MSSQFSNLLEINVSLKIKAMYTIEVEPGGKQVKMKSLKVLKTALYEICQKKQLPEPSSESVEYKLKHNGRLKIQSEKVRVIVTRKKSRGKNQGGT